MLDVVVLVVHSTQRCSIVPPHWRRHWRRSGVACVDDEVDVKAKASVYATPAPTWSRRGVAVARDWYAEVCARAVTRATGAETHHQLSVGTRTY